MFFGRVPLRLSMKQGQQEQNQLPSQQAHPSRLQVVQANEFYFHALFVRAFDEWEKVPPFPLRYGYRNGQRTEHLKWDQKELIFSDLLLCGHVYVRRRKSLGQKGQRNFHQFRRVTRNQGGIIIRKAPGVCVSTFILLATILWFSNLFLSCALFSPFVFVHLLLELSSKQSSLESESLFDVLQALTTQRTEKHEHLQRCQELS